jgi:menaquinone-9 beta-reductase
VAGDFLALAGPPVRRVAAGAGETMVDAPLPRSSFMEWGRALGREHLDMLLRDAAVSAGTHLFQPAEVTALEKTARGHTIALTRKDATESFTARVVVAACGSWNAKGPFAIDTAPRPSDLLAFKAHLRGAKLPADLMPLLAFPGGYGGMVHSDGGRVSLSCCIRRDALARARDIHGGKAAEAVLAHIRASIGGARAALDGAQPDGALLSVGPVRPGIRPRYQGGVFFTGNSAGEAHPIIAEGISMAIQSSWLLARHLIVEGPAAADHYARDWRARFGVRIAAAALFAHCAMHDRSRAAAARLIRTVPSILTWGAALSGKATPAPRKDWHDAA